jgi:FemAB-related protein (PEP-CTERM system-associated)
MEEPWDDYVCRHPAATHCHRWGWRTVIVNAFDLPVFYLVAGSQGSIRGVLPLAWQRSALFGSFLTAIPFLNAGGPLADSLEIEQALVDHAISLAAKLGAAHLQLRYRGEYHLALPALMQKVAAVREVSSDTDSMWRSISSNNRRKVNKASKSGLTVQAEGASALDDFYEIFADNMRNLGTPVYAKKLFSETLLAFPGETDILMLRLGERPVAAAFLNCFRDVIEATWICSHYEYLQLQPNMLLYWSILRVAGERGFRMVDFGRSTRDAGTHKFKQLWNTTDVPLPWAYWTPMGEAAGKLSPANPKYQLATSIWKRLPLPLCNAIGPHIVRNLP